MDNKANRKSYEQIVNRAIALMGDGSEIAHHLCSLAMQYQAPSFSAVTGLRLADILPLPIPSAAPPVARRCQDHAAMFRLLVGVKLRAQCQRVLRELVADPAAFGDFFSYADSASYGDAEHRLADALMERNRMKTIGELLVRSENTFGFFEYDPGDPNLINQWRSPEMQVRHSGAAGVEEEVMLFSDAEETQTLNLRFVWARAYRGPVCIAAALGYLVEPRRANVTDAEVYDAFNSHSERLANFSYYAMLQHGGVKGLFHNGGVFYLHHWEVTMDERGQGLGASLLVATIRVIAKHQPGTGTIAVDLAPRQYAYPLPPYCPPDVHTKYETDCRGLQSYWDRLQPHRHLLSGRGRTLHLTVMHALTRQDEQDILASYYSRAERLQLHH